MDPTRKKSLPTTITTSAPPPPPPPNPIPSSTVIMINKINKADNPKKVVSNHYNKKTPLPSDPPLGHLYPKALALLSHDAAMNSSFLNKTHENESHNHSQPTNQKTTIVNMDKQKQRKTSQKVKKATDDELIMIHGGRGKRSSDEETKRIPSLSKSVLIGGGGGGGGGERRRRSLSSLCNCTYSGIELGEFLMKIGARVVAADMLPFMQIHAVSCARQAYDSLDNFSSKTLASILKKEFDGVYGLAWHCIVGSSFGSFVTHSVGGFLYFSLTMDHKLYVLLFKTTVQISPDDD